MSEAKHQVAPPLTNQRFVTTHWSVVLTSKAQDARSADTALEQLCRTYWGPLYAYIRRAGHPPADAADLTQSFFARFLEKQFLQDVDQQKGKFRSFLLKALNHFLADEWRHAHAAKRADSYVALSINAEDWETRHGHELVSGLTPEKIFERRWAMALFDQALNRLRHELVDAGKGSHFDRLKEFLTRAGSESEYGTVASELNLSPATVPVQVHRLRKRYGELVREEVVNTVACPGEVEAELRHLLNVLSE